MVITLIVGNLLRGRLVQALTAVVANSLLCTDCGAMRRILGTVNIEGLSGSPDMLFARQEMLAAKRFMEKEQRTLATRFGESAKRTNESFSEMRT